MPIPGRIAPSRFLVCAVLLLLFGGVSLQVFSAPLSFEGGISRDLLEEARAVFEAGDRETAQFLLRRAYGVDPETGDPLFLLARMLPQDRLHSSLRERLLQKSRDLSLRETSLELIVAELAQLLIETNRPAQARQLLEDFHDSRNEPGEGALAVALKMARSADSEMPQHPGPEELDALDYLFLKALLETEPFWVFSALMQRFRSRFPRDRALATMDFERSRRVSLGQLEWLEAALAEPPGDIQEQLDLARAIGAVLSHFPHTLSGQAGRTRHHLTRWYYYLGGEDPLFAVPFLLDVPGVPGEDFALSRETRSLVEQALHEGDKRLWEAASQTLRRNDPQERSWKDGPFPPGGLFGPVWDQISGDQTVRLFLHDTPRLGLEEYHFEDRSLAAWKRDRTGDGLFDEVLLFSGGAEGNLVFFFRQSYNQDQDRVDGAKQEQPESVLGVYYSRYPLVSRVVRYHLDREEEGQGSRWSEVPPAERVCPSRSVLWIPARPVPHDIGLRLEETDGFVTDLPSRVGGEPFSLWNGLAGRVTLTPRDDRFLRQLGSDDARTLNSHQAREATEQLRELGVIR
ncbi:hypothetical protein SAMN05920897_105111 [Alkalispirochaeta americana]|uniref:Tetratricopeptide repeat-containing protein n=2 Tax=Alkalispirochaeta americana TaxID=159291 RepID=A0A1N6QZG1_9SPIO|nr:hypothetical protein SAMN05920897_105111 [Alkalispirochaeta americana]